MIHTEYVSTSDYDFEVDFTITPYRRGNRDSLGFALEPDEDAEINIVKVTCINDPNLSDEEIDSLIDEIKMGVIEKLENYDE